MKHRIAGRKLGRTSEHRRAMLRNLSTALFEKERIRTTLMKAKELRPFAEKLITLSKRETLHARRQILRDIKDKTVVAKLFDTLSPRYAERPGGYTRIIKLGPRRGDNAEMAFIELVGGLTDRGKPEKPKKKATRKKAPVQKDDAGKAEAAPEKKTTKKKTAKKAKTAKKKASKKASKKKAETGEKATKKTTKKRKSTKKKSAAKKSGDS